MITKRNKHKNNSPSNKGIAMSINEPDKDRKGIYHGNVRVSRTKN